MNIHSIKKKENL